MSGEAGQRLKWPLRITAERRGGALVLRAAGRLGHASAGILGAAIDDAIGRGNHRIVVDLAQVDYVSSAGLLEIQSAAAKLETAQGALVLCAVSETVRIALDLAGLHPHCPIEPSCEDAIALVVSR